MEKENDNVESTPMTHVQQLDNEISSYLECRIAEAETSPLVWWIADGRVFPTWSHLAMKYLCISGTIVPSQRVFSRGGQIVNPLHGRLHPKNVNKLIFFCR